MEHQTQPAAIKHAQLWYMNALRALVAPPRLPALCMGFHADA